MTKRSFIKQLIASLGLGLAAFLGYKPNMVAEGQEKPLKTYPKQVPTMVWVNPNDKSKYAYCYEWWNDITCCMSKTGVAITGLNIKKGCYQVDYFYWEPKK